MQLVFASTNPHKLREIREIFAPLGVAVREPREFGRALPEPVESEPTLVGNARLKAVSYARALGRACLADDSGLEVDALDGAPGVHSARFAGRGTTRAERDHENRVKLLAELAELAELAAHGTVSRRARLVCVLCLADAAGRVLFETRGSMEAVILPEPRGKHGFGYDSVLLVPDLGRTLAELAPHELHARSHRGSAARALHAWLLEHPLPPEA